MRWYVSRNGDSSGPHEETIVADWARANQLSGAMLRDEAASAWVPVSQTPFSALIPSPAPTVPGAALAASPAAQKPPNARRIFVLFGVFGVLVFFYFVVTSGDGPSSTAFPLLAPGVAVECVGNGLGYTCTLTHTSGNAAAKACWDIAIACHNGTKAVANACQTVEPHGKATAFIPIGDIRNAEACDVATAVNVQNMRLVAP